MSIQSGNHRDLLLARESGALDYTLYRELEGAIESSGEQAVQMARSF